MKALNFSLFTLFLMGIFLASCKKESSTPAPTQNATKLFARTLKVYDAAGTNSAIVRFQSSSRELLAKMAIDKFDFVLVKTPEPPSGNSSGPSASSPLGKKDFSVENAIRQKSIADKLHGLDSVVYVDIISEANTPSVSIEIKSKAIKGNQFTGKPSEESLYPAGVNVFFRGGYGWHRVQIENLSWYRLHVAFYFDSCDGNVCSTHGDVKGTFTQYSGYSYTLYHYGWAWYSKCSRSVGALLTTDPYAGYWFRWTVWSNC